MNRELVKQNCRASCNLNSARFIFVRTSVTLKSSEQRHMNKQQSVFEEALRATTRRHFFRKCGVGLGGLALTSLLSEKLLGVESAKAVNPLAARPPHFAAKAKRVIYLH